MQANPKQPASFGAWGRRWPSTQYVVRHSFGLSKHHALLRKRACNRVSFHFPVLEAAAAAAVQAVDEQPPYLNYAEVNRHNFKAVLPVLRAAIQEATFVAIDTEFTGLAPYGSSYPDDSLDDYEERYKRLLAAADNFVICQVGTGNSHQQAGNGRPLEKPQSAIPVTPTPPPTPACPLPSLLASCITNRIKFCGASAVWPVRIQMAYSSRCTAWGLLGGQDLQRLHLPPIRRLG